MLYNGVELHRENKIIFAKFLLPHRVISTCRVAGGLREDLSHVYNHQSCEPAGHMTHMTKIAVTDPEAYRKQTCEPYGLPADACATLGTAANMRNACIETRRFEDLSVSCVCTGGVEGNAGRAGDPASVVETDEGFQRLPRIDAPPAAGTINMMIFINRPLIPGAMTRSVVTATEAKSATLQELCVNSRYSSGLATGTGTDQIAVAAALNGQKALTSAGKHAKLGELIGRSVKAAVKGTLALQNGLTPSGQRSAKIHLERFGIDREEMTAAVCRHLPEETARLLQDNFSGIDRDPVTVAAVAALVHLEDKFSWGILPGTCRPEIMGAFAAQIACSVSGDYDKMADYRKALAPSPDTGITDLACRAMALGFADKWERADRKKSA
jgi:adenosylcobinamide amidohydrolase